MTIVAGPNTAVVGAGYAGIATAVGLAESGLRTLLVEKDRDRLAALVDGRIPFHEPGLADAYAREHAAGRILPSAEMTRVGLKLILICVGTPIDETGSTCRTSRMPSTRPCQQSLQGLFA